MNQAFHQFAATTNGEIARMKQETKNLEAALEQGIPAATLAAYPIGSCYMSTEKTSPALSIGGTWEPMESTGLPEGIHLWKRIEEPIEEDEKGGETA